MSDVEVGAFLSGGVDSGAVTAVAAQHMPGMKSFTCGFDLSSASGMELNFDERAQADPREHPDEAQRAPRAQRVWRRGMHRLRGLTGPNASSALSA